MQASGGGIGAGGTHEALGDKELRQAGTVTSLGFIHAFVASLSVIVVSELGDKTFFIAAIMAMRHSRCTVFTGAISALALMTVLSGKVLTFFSIKTVRNKMIAFRLEMA